MDIKARFFKAFDFLKAAGRIENQEQLAEIINTNKAGISDIKAGRKKLTIEHVIDFVKAHSDINLEWLVLGKGSMKISDRSAEKSDKPEIHMPKMVTVDKSGHDNIVLVPVKAAAGYLNGYADPEFLQTLPAYSMPNISNGTFRMFQVKGHSMNPTLHNGSYVVGEFVENWIRDIKDDRVYVIVCLNDGVVVKRVLNRIKKYGNLYCKSDNRTEYPSYSLDPEEIIEVWEYKMHLGYELPNPANLYDRISDLEAKVFYLDDKIGKKRLKSPEN